jgi:hypothetical protein
VGQIEVSLETSTGRHSFPMDDDLLFSMGVTVENLATAKLFLGAWLALLADSPSSLGQKPLRLYHQFISNMVRYGLKGTILSYAELAHVLVSQQCIMGQSSLQGDWIDGFRDTPVFFEYVRYHKTADPAILSYLYTFLNFGKKLEYVDEQFQDSAFRGWLDTEKRLTTLELDSTDVRSMRMIMSTLLPPFTWTDLRPKFGPGAVFEKGVWGNVEKLSLLTRDPLIERFLLSGQLGMYGSGGSVGVDPTKIGFSPTTAIMPTDRTSRLLFVPKSLKTYRSVCIEHNVLMYWQQAVSAQMMVHVNSSPYRQFFRLEDQSRNRDLALYGSYTAAIDTLDLSSASDSVSWDLVKRIFPPSWVIAMAVTRSSRVVLPNGDVFPVRKFAPMGSAVCFPTQSLIFATGSIYAACRHVHAALSVDAEFTDWLTPSVVRRVVRSFARQPSLSRRYGYEPCGIYGDDIAIDSRLSDVLIPILTRLGFVVNTTKSFYGGQAFRESCGGFYLNGSDITPLYFRVECGLGRFSPRQVMSEVHLSNDAFVRGYKTLRRYLIRSMNIQYSERNPRDRGSLPIMYIPLGVEAFGLYSHRPSNEHLRQRTNKDWQRIEVRVWSASYEEETIASSSFATDQLESYLYMRWWAGCTRESDAATKAAPRYDRRGLKLRRRWAPAC